MESSIGPTGVLVFILIEPNITGERRIYRGLIYFNI